MTAPAADVAAPTDQTWFTTREAATYTRRHPVTVRKAAAAWPAAGALQSTQSGSGRGRRYRREWLDRWIGQ